jgi:hypothetical protein
VQVTVLGSDLLSFSQTPTNLGGGGGKASIRRLDGDRGPFQSTRANRAGTATR